MPTGEPVESEYQREEDGELWLVEEHAVIKSVREESLGPPSRTAPSGCAPLASAQFACRCCRFSANRDCNPGQKIRPYRTCAFGAGTFRIACRSVLSCLRE